MKFLAVAAVLVVISQCDGKVFSRCELARELRRQKFPENQLRNCESFMTISYIIKLLQCI
jgi:hypothetical protein